MCLSVSALSEGAFNLNSALAWRSVRLFVSIKLFSSSVNLKSRSLFAIAAWVKDSLAAICSCVKWYISISAAIADASSNILRSFLCRFSIILKVDEESEKKVTQIPRIKHFFGSREIVKFSFRLTLWQLQ